jgi:hypothetical protein
MVLCEGCDRGTRVSLAYDHELSRELIASMFTLLILGIFITADGQEVVGLVMVCIAAAIGGAVRLTRESRR